MDLKMDDKRDSIPSLSKTTSSSTGETVKKQGSFMSKIFSRPNLASKEMNTTKSRMIDEDAPLLPSRADPLDGLLITPCPYVRPLGFKLQARIESGPGNARLMYTGAVHRTDSTREITLYREEADRAFADPLLNINANHPILRGTKSQPELNSQIDHLLLYQSPDTEDNISMGVAKQHQDFASMAAPDASSVASWKAYIQSYSEGRFNLIKPPHPPLRATTFTYLPAVLPDDEEQRRSVGREYQTVWPQWEDEKAGALILGAMKQFDTKYASISFFDGKNETFKAENGYNRGRIPRDISIAAHVLVSTDVMVVLDTKKDWRFAGNPLVKKTPSIRFFAGAPMLAPGGEVVGVFAILGKLPRTSFSPFQRRELAEFGRSAMEDLNRQAEWLTNSDLRSTPILQRSSLINADTQPSRPYTPSRSRESDYLTFDMDMFPSALRCQVPPPKPRKSLLFMSKECRDASEPTPPSSRGSEAQPSTQNHAKGFGKNLKELSVNSYLDHGIHDLVTPDSAGFVAQSPRPFSSSDLTSLDPHPPNTPNGSLADNSDPSLPRIDLTIENFMSLTDLDIAEPENNPPSSPLIDLESPQPRVKHDSISTDMSIRSSGSRKVTGDAIFMAEAAFSCSFTAQSLDYDLVYAAEVKPIRESMTEEELLRPGGVTVRILVAYGLNRRVELCAATHLRILRSKGYETIEHIPDYRYDEDEYEVGHMIRLTDDGLPREERRTGIVFGAFRKPRPELLVQLDTPPRASVEIQKLVGAANTLGSIIRKTMENRKAPGQLPGPSDRSSYPAKAAGEVEDSSFDTRV